MSNWLNYDIDVLASSTTEIDQISKRLRQPSTDLLDYLGRKWGKPVTEITEQIKGLFEFDATRDVGYEKAGVSKSREYRLSFKDRYDGIVKTHLFEVSEDFSAAIFLLTYCDVESCYSGKQVIRAGELIRQLHDSHQPSQGLDWCLVDISAPFKAEYYNGLEFGSLWQDWLAKLAAVVAELNKSTIPPGDNSQDT